MLARLVLFFFGRKVTYDRKRIPICFGLDDGGVLNIVRRKYDTVITLLDDYDNTVCITDERTLTDLARKYVPSGELLTLYYRSYLDHNVYASSVTA